MAEGWARHLEGQRVEASSAGIEARGLDTRAVRVMREAGIDIASQRSTSLDELDLEGFDWVVTVCSDADQRCPALGGSTRRIHAGFDDPPRLAAAAATEEAALAHYRRVRDEIRRLVETLPERIGAGP